MQRDLKLSEARTILIDGNTGKWEKPQWLSETSFLKTHFPDIEIILDKTQTVARTQACSWEINYLHIDAERTLYGAFNDFCAYLPYMAKNSTITLHDTGPGQPCAGVVAMIQKMGYEVINFKTFGTGVAVIYIP